MDQTEVPATEDDIKPVATLKRRASASPREQTEKVVPSESSAGDMPGPSSRHLKFGAIARLSGYSSTAPAAKVASSLAVTFADVEPSSDRHSSVEPAFRSSQGFSSMYGESEPEDDDDDVEKAAEEISAFIARDLASSIVDEEEDAERAHAVGKRPPVDVSLPVNSTSTVVSADAGPAVTDAAVDLPAAAAEDMPAMRTTPSRNQGAAAVDSDIHDVPGVAVRAAGGADIAPTCAASEIEPAELQADAPPASAGLEQDSPHPVEAPSPQPLPPSDLPIAMPIPGAAEPRLPTPPFSPLPVGVSATVDDYYAPEEPKDAYFAQDEGFALASVSEEADVASQAPSGVSHEVRAVGSLERCRPSDQLSYAAGPPSALT